MPETKQLRERIRTKCVEVAAKLDKSRPMGKDEMEVVVRAMLEELGLGEGYVGWAMVVLSGEFWRDQVAAVPPSRRLFLLPHCLKHAEGCPADYDDFGLDCEKCGACSIADFRGMAEKMGYKVLVAEGSPIVLKIIVSLMIMIWIRATLPRLRYDRLMAFGWKVLMPTSLVIVFLTALWITLTEGLV